MQALNEDHPLRSWTLSELEEPRDWQLPTPMRQRMRILQGRDKKRTALRQIHAGGATTEPPCTLPDDYRGMPVDGRMPDAAIRKLAVHRAGLMADRIDAIAEPSESRALLAWLNVTVAELDARRDVFAFARDASEADQLAGFLLRARCPKWWRAQLRRAVVTRRETEGRLRAEVCARKQIYVTDDTLYRRIDQNRRNAEMLDATRIESEDGETISLAVAAGASVSNRSIRRGELMTRIRGCEEWADARGMAGLFTTNTAPSRFHPQKFGGGRNPKHDGTYGPVQPNAPRDAQAWLCATWARARAQLQRLAVPFFGFRVAEPHHDGCPHWHMLLWTAPEHLDALRRVLRAQWLKDHPDEWGAGEHRLKAVAMEKGGAAGYIAKYIAKNIDDPTLVADADGQVDEWADGQGELFGGAAARRVEAWASAHRIRQFQAIGQPPVTVWRELRRVEADRAAGGSPAVQLAHKAATRDLLRKADWRLYMEAQGGPMVGRRYAVRMLTEDREIEGRYGVVMAPAPIGVVDRLQPDAWILSSRREWKPRGQWLDSAENRIASAKAPALGVDLRGYRGSESATKARPWTRVNNCTQDGGVAALMNAGIVGVMRRDALKIEPGGSQPHEEPPWTRSNPLNPPSSMKSRLWAAISSRSPAA